MRKTQDIPEYWVVYQATESSNYEVGVQGRDEDVYRKIAQLEGNDETARTDAHRIVACVNACIELDGLRDHFASQAMMGLQISMPELSNQSISKLAEWAYQQADAMLEAREALAKATGEGNQK